MGRLTTHAATSAKDDDMPDLGALIHGIGVWLGDNLGGWASLLTILVVIGPIGQKVMRRAPHYFHSLTFAALSHLVPLVVLAFGGIVLGIAGTQEANAFHRHTTIVTTQTLLNDPLSSDSNGWPQDRWCAFMGGAYHVRNSFQCAPSMAHLPELSDFTITVDARLVSDTANADASAGFVFHRPERTPDNYYGYEVTGDGRWQFYKVAANGYAIRRPFIPNSAIHTGVGQVNKLQVQVRGAHFSFFVNGIQVGEVDDSAYPAGYTALIAEKGLDVAFTNFVVTIPLTTSLGGGDAIGAIVSSALSPDLLAPSFEATIALSAMLISAMMWLRDMQRRQGGVPALLPRPLRLPRMPRRTRWDKLGGGSDEF